MDNFKSNMNGALAPNAEALARQLTAQFTAMPDVSEMVAAVEVDVED